MVLRFFSVMLRLFLLTLVTFYYFLLLFLLVVSSVSYFLLGLGVRFVTFVIFFIGRKFSKLLFTRFRGKVCYFLLLLLLLVTLINYFLLCQEGQGLYCIHCATGKRCTLFILLLFF